jgi:hypothetical protein
MLARTTCAALRKVEHRFPRPTARMKRAWSSTLPSDQLCLGAPRSHQRTWVNQDGAKPHQSSDNLSPKQNLGAPYLARLWRDVGFHRSIPEIFPPSVLIHSPGWSVSSQRAACSPSAPRVQTGNPGERSGKICGFLFPVLTQTLRESRPHTEPNPELKLRVFPLSLSNDRQVCIRILPVSQEGVISLLSINLIASHGISSAQL